MIWCFLCGMQFSYAQMGIGTEFPNPSAALEVAAEHRGVLIPRVALQSLSDQTTMTHGNVESLLIYNTTTNAQLLPGFYYWAGQDWRRLTTSADLEAMTVVQTNYTASLKDDYILVDAQQQNVTVNLPNAQLLKGKTLRIKKMDLNEDHYLYVQGNISGISGQNQLYTALPYSGWLLMSNGTQWVIVDKLH